MKSEELEEKFGGYENIFQKNVVWGGGEKVSNSWNLGGKFSKKRSWGAPYY